MPPPLSARPSVCLSPSLARYSCWRFFARCLFRFDSSFRSPAPRFFVLFPRLLSLFLCGLRVAVSNSKTWERQAALPRLCIVDYGRLGSSYSAQPRCHSFRFIFLSSWLLSSPAKGGTLVRGIRGAF
jgi:hypothetical protein